MEQPSYNDSILIDGYRYSVDLATVLSAPKDIKSLDGMQRGVRYIGTGAFAGCEDLLVVDIPMTVIRIGDFAFLDCCNIQELHLPYDMEYISPSAFVSLRKDSHFFLQIPRIIFPEEEFVRYAQMIPQYVREWDAKKYGVDEETLEEVDGYDLNGLPICANEHDLYRMLLMAEVEPFSICEDGKDKTLKPEGNIEEEILDIVLQHAKSFMTKSELVDVDEYPLINNIDESFSVIIDNHVSHWYKFSRNSRPMEILSHAVDDALTMGFIAATEYDDHTYDYELYGESFGEWVLAMYGDVWDGFRRVVLSKDRELERYYKAMNLDASDILTAIIKDVGSAAHELSPAFLHKIVHSTMNKLFHIGFSYGLKYKRSHKS